MKTTFKIHPIYIIVAFICLLTGYFRLLVTTTLIILFHELGHIFMMLYFKIPIDKIIIWRDNINKRYSKPKIISRTFNRYYGTHLSNHILYNI